MIQKLYEKALLPLKRIIKFNIVVLLLKEFTLINNTKTNYNI